MSFSFPANEISINRIHRYSNSERSIRPVHNTLKTSINNNKSNKLDNPVIISEASDKDQPEAHLWHSES